MFRFLLPTLFLITYASAQIPDGYYDAAMGLDGAELQQALHDIIDDHQQQSYTSLWTHFQTTDVKANGKVWDMYSDVPDGTPAYEFTFVVDQDHGTGGGSEGEFYNREHSWPKSWFGDGYPMYTDLFHLYPTDKLVNSKRGSYPYGEVSNPTWTSTNGSKLGPNTFPGYSGTAFEPIDAYKGDFARSYFYMAMRYYGEDAGWPGSDMVTGSQLNPWALDMLLEWDGEDPVSQKEIDRNDAVYSIQGNRNPCIDHPEYVSYLWRGVKPVAVHDSQEQPDQHLLISVYPNPFNAGTVFSLAVQDDEQVAITLYDLHGREVRQLVNSFLTAGHYKIPWDGNNSESQFMSSGIYLAVISSPAGVSVKRLTLIR